VRGKTSRITVPAILVWTKLFAYILYVNWCKTMSLYMVAGWLLVLTPCMCWYPVS
jgi:hypothetical protein